MKQNPNKVPSYIYATTISSSDDAEYYS